MFRHRCSFLIHSPSFDALPEELRERFWKRMEAALDGEEAGNDFGHLAAAEREAIRGILAATKRGAPAAWGGR